MDDVGRFGGAEYETFVAAGSPGAAENYRDRSSKFL